jgi:hypothetical protein
MSFTRSAALRHPQPVLDGSVYVLNQFNVYGTSNQVKAPMHTKNIICHELRIMRGYVSAPGFRGSVIRNYIDWKDNLMCRKYLIHYEKNYEPEI